MLMVCTPRLLVYEMFFWRLLVLQKPDGKLTFKNSPAISVVFALVPSNRPEPRAAPSTAADSFDCTMYRRVPSIASPINGIRRSGTIDSRRMIVAPRRGRLLRVVRRILFLIPPNV